ncbi:MAG: cytochrome-c oxidase, cbb3-type subunit III [Roseiarcus sp.]|jgi:cytochrome c oxidase cbb3-type subunit 3
MATTEPNQVDSVTGQTTTGHEWDGIRELNTPLPRWWLWTFYACILFAIVYWVLYPAWPLVSGFSRGALAYSSRGQVAEDIQAIQAQRAQTEAGLDKASVTQIVADKKLLSLALAHGKAAFAEDCAPCHGSGGQGSKGYRNLTNEDWLWGGTLDDIQTTITHGIRADYDKDTRSSAMPAFGRDGVLKPEEIRQVASYVRTLSKLEPEAGVDVAAGKKVFADNCAVCHGDDGKGNLAMGSANLTDGLQLYGGDFKDLIQTITYARNSTMPAWGARLDPVTIKSLAVYVHSLGAGQ